MQKAWSFEPSSRPPASELAQTMVENGRAIIESAIKINAAHVLDNGNKY